MRKALTTSPGYPGCLRWLPAPSGRHTAPPCSSALLRSEGWLLPDRRRRRKRKRGRRGRRMKLTQAGP